MPITFAAEGDTVWTAVDSKPKQSRSLQRLANISAHPTVSLLVDHYTDDWSQLWWVRVDGVARQLEPGSAEETGGLRRLVTKYPQYRTDPPAGPVVEVSLTGWRSWAWDPTAPDGGESAHDPRP